MEIHLHRFNLALSVLGCALNAMWPLAPMPLIMHNCCAQLHASRGCTYKQGVGSSSVCMQVWVPGFNNEGLVLLSCRDAPYAVAGEGDMCANFRCISTRHVFYPSMADPNKRGSIGRVFKSHKVGC